MTDVLNLFLIVYGPRKRDWRDRILILEFVISIKLLLVGFNFALSVYSCFPKFCGYWYQITEARNDNTEMNSDFFGGKLVAGLQWYDVRVIGVYHLLASVNHCISAMLLCVKWNDLKMYVLWRMRKLEQYIQDLFLA